MTRVLRLIVLLALLAATTNAQSPDRIIAIGDIHGSIEGLTSILKVVGLIDGGNKWTGGKARLLQTGDYMDRGEHTRAVMDLLMDLEKQADDAGGKAIVLLGNHEVMNLIGETRDATKEIFAKFADADSEKRREAAWGAYGKLAENKKQKGEPVPSVYAQPKEQWLAARPLGYVEYKEALGPKGKYGAWLRGKAMVTEVDGNIFMHAGIPPGDAPAKIEDLNDQLRGEIKKLDKLVDSLIDQKLATRDFSLNEILQVASAEIGLANARISAARDAGKEFDRSQLNMSMLMDAQDAMKINTWLAINGDKALWYRGLATEPDDPTGGPFAVLLQKYGAKRFVTGHTPQQNRSINLRFGGRAVLIDTGMLTAVYKGRASALEIAGTKLTAYYTDGKTELQK